MKYVIPAALLAVALSAQPAFAADAPVTLSKCDKPIGSIAVVDGETQGWTKYGLSSPRDLIAAMAVQSNCFTLQNVAGGQPVDFLVNAIAGDKEEVDQGTSLAQTALTEGLVRSGMAGRMAGSIPFGGQALSMFGGFGGKKKTIAAGLRIISPANGQTIVTGSGTQTKTQVSIGGLGGIGGNPWADAARAQMTSMGYGDYAGGGYSTSKDGQMLTSAFVIAFNNVVAQQAALAAVRPATAAAAATPAAAKPGFTTAVDTKLFAQPAAGEAVRALRAGTALTPTGVREGLFVEVSDAYGTKGWVSVEDLK
ncbi:SH3 domain-containing protein [Rhizorhabdus wittichii]|uniref:SH3 domain-containing protein n=1 Tax=Rhizorhabdus wittichii TaxID=160791 RepID=A0A975CZL6_9SPHN|nr:SH3 domain-containing protein [Rhizorhabdus wittichii]QTH19984.1 SH3 domain-containing protein [Rhizorhabdus wittichii]